jgi:hypothetical protein
VSDVQRLEDELKLAKLEERYNAAREKVASGKASAADLKRHKDLGAEFAAARSALRAKGEAEGSRHPVATVAAKVGGN